MEKKEEKKKVVVKKGNKQWTFNAGVKDSKPKPIKVIVERGEVVDIQHHTCVVFVVIGTVIRFWGRIEVVVVVLRRPHFFHREIDVYASLSMISWGNNKQPLRCKSPKKNNTLSKQLF